MSTTNIVSSSENLGALSDSTTTLIGVGGVFLIIAIYFIFTHNSIINAKNSVEESLSSIDTVFQLRYDLIPNLVEVVKQYMSHEQNLISKVTELRSNLISNNNKGTKEYFNDENSLQSGLKSIFAIAENYPELKASNNFIELQTEWSQTENRLQAARRAYNSALKELVNKKEMFPSNIVASMMKIKHYDFFEAEEQAKVNISAKQLFNS